MSVLVASKDIYLSTQQSGAPGTTDQVFSRFRMCLNTNPLVCDNSEQTRLSVTQFNSPRQFYDIHQYNNRFDIFFNANPTTTAADGANHRPDPQIGSFQLTCRDIWAALLRFIGASVTGLRVTMGQLCPHTLG